MPDRSAQSTDAVNSAPLGGSRAVEDDVRVKQLGSIQKIAQGRANLGGLDASGNEAPVTAPVSAGK